MASAQSSAAAAKPPRVITLRNAIALMVLPWLVLLILGMGDAGNSLVKWRFQYLARSEGAEWFNHWFGTIIEQYPADLMLYQELIYKIKPDVIIETGTDYGGGALYLATILEIVNDQGKVVTIDIDGSHWRNNLPLVTVQGKDKLLQRIVFLEGSSTAPETVAKVAAHLKPDSKVLVILDSDHSRAHVLQELKIYSAFVSLDSYIIVNDTQWGAPLAAVNDFLPTTDRFKIDPVDRFTVSCAHSGFLKRVK